MSNYFGLDYLNPLLSLILMVLRSWITFKMDTTPHFIVLGMSPLKPLFLILLDFLLEWHLKRTRHWPFWNAHEKCVFVMCNCCLLSDSQTDRLLRPQRQSMSVLILTSIMISCYQWNDLIALSFVKKLLT